MREPNRHKPSSSTAKKVGLPVPLPVMRAMVKLGNDICLARRRRRISQESLAERLGTSVSTIHRMEKGSGHTPLLVLARALHVFSELPRLENLLDTAKDDVGLTLMDEQLPQRIRAPRNGLNGAL